MTEPCREEEAPAQRVAGHVADEVAQGGESVRLEDEAHQIPRHDADDQDGPDKRRDDRRT